MVRATRWWHTHYYLYGCGDYTDKLNTRRTLETAKVHHVLNLWRSMIDICIKGKT